MLYIEHFEVFFEMVSVRIFFQLFGCLKANLIPLTRRYSQKKNTSISTIAKISHPSGREKNCNFNAYS